VLKAEQIESRFEERLEKKGSGHMFDRGRNMVGRSAIASQQRWSGTEEQGRWRNKMGLFDFIAHIGRKGF
jgi:hypothetical protein